MKAATVNVIGKVQGVWFRASTKSKANELNLCGNVKNKKDGSVFIEVEGSEENLKKFIKWCETGPEMASVENIIISEALVNNFIDFKIIRH